MKGLKHSFIVPRILLLLALALFLAPEAMAMEGAGTKADPYVVNSPAELLAMGNDLAAHYALGADISLARVAWKPLGNTLDGPFSGSLDGRGHTITDLTLDLGDTKFVGLFGYLEGEVKDLSLAGALITGKTYVGGIAGEAGVGAVIENCQIRSGWISSTSTTSGAAVGGIAGLCEGTITGCTNGAGIGGGRSSSGGIAGLSEGVVTGCTNRADIGGGLYSGGIVGQTNYDNLEITDCKSEGDSVSSSDLSGGIVGYAKRPVTIRNCSNSAKIRSSDLGNAGGAGGIMGQGSMGAHILSCVNTGSVVGSDSYAGGIAGALSGKSVLEACENYGDITSYGSGKVWASGIVGAEHITGVPSCMASIGGNPNPSAKERNRNVSAA